MEHIIWEILFNIVFMSQVLLLSYYLPKKVLNRMSTIMEKYPPETHPRLYPKPLKYYQSAKVFYQYFNHFVVFIGLMLSLSLFQSTFDIPLDKFFGLYFLIQLLPIMFIQSAMHEQFKLMRKADSRKIRTANLQQLRLIDILPFGLMVGFGFLYLILVALTFLYVKQSDIVIYLMPLVIIIIFMLFMLPIIWEFYGKKRNPYQSYQDKKVQLRSRVEQALLVCIALVLFILVFLFILIMEIPINSYLMMIACSLYIQFVGIIAFRMLYFQSLYINETNLDIYRENPSTT